MKSIIFKVYIEYHELDMTQKVGAPQAVLKSQILFVKLRKIEYNITHSVFSKGQDSFQQKKVQADRMDVDLSS